MTLPDESLGSTRTDPARSSEASSPTRSQQTRAATAVNRLGLELTRLSQADLDHLELSERLREAIDVSQKLKARGRGRQNRLIGQLLRAEDHETIRARLESLGGRDRGRARQEIMIEEWRDRLIEEGDPAVEDLICKYPLADRQRLRLLVRNASKNPQAKQAKRARLELLRAIRTLIR
ncbi:MAG: ribosome biogenesis factor YjgA [Myxococcota bacterium]